jgi:hypothetical protein
MKKRTGRAKKLGATKYIYELSDGTKVIINEAECKRRHGARHINLTWIGP